MTAVSEKRTAGAVTRARLDLAHDAAELRRDGFTFREIADILDISRTYAEQLVSDPDGAKARARKDGYRIPCVGCGKLLTGSYGPNSAKARERTGLCVQCQHDEMRVWTPDTIVAAFQQFYDEVGRPPAVSDLHVRYPSHARRYSATRRAEVAATADAVDRILPHQSTVQTVMGGWRNALVAAGFEVNRGGEPTHREPRTA